MKTKVTIYSNNLKKAVRKAHEIVTESGEKIIVEKLDTFYNNVLETHSMLIKLSKGTESSVGMRSNVVYIDRSIPKDIVNEVILPTLVPVSFRVYDNKESSRKTARVYYFG